MARVVELLEAIDAAVLRRAHFSRQRRQIIQAYDRLRALIHGDEAWQVVLEIEACWRWPFAWRQGLRLGKRRVSAGSMR
jgi:hypothetical protein